MTVDRTALVAVMKLAAPTAAPFDIDAAVDAALACLGNVTTADRLPPAARPQPPEPAEGQRLVEVVEVSEREWPDSGRVLTLSLRLVDEPDAEPIRCRFDVSRAVIREIAIKALGGLGDDEDVEALVGRRAVIEPKPYQTRDGEQRLGVGRWIVPRKPRAAAKRAPSGPRPKPEMPDDGDCPF